jgi:hypothetical protein
METTESRSERSDSRVDDRSNPGKGVFMSEEAKAKRSVTLQLDAELLTRIEEAARQMPPGWDLTRVFEVGAVELLERLGRKWNKGKPFSPPSASSPPEASQGR